MCSSSTKFSLYEQSALEQNPEQSFCLASCNQLLQSYCPQKHTQKIGRKYHFGANVEGLQLTIGLSILKNSITDAFLVQFVVHQPFNLLTVLHMNHFSVRLTTFMLLFSHPSIKMSLLSSVLFLPLVVHAAPCKDLSQLSYFSQQI